MSSVESSRQVQTRLTTNSGGKFTLRLLKPVTPILFESLLFALIGDQFAETDSAVGCVLSVRQAEDILSVWVEEEGEAVKSGALKYVSSTRCAGAH